MHANRTGREDCAAVPAAGRPGGQHRIAGVSVVIPTTGRPCLARLLDRLAGQVGRSPVPVEVIVVDDRPRPDPPLPLPPGISLLTGRAAGPAAARNTGTGAARHEWVAFLDDDVVPDPGWLDDLVDDLARQGGDVAGVQGRLSVPMPPGAPDDFARTTAGLATARWATADMAYRRRALLAVGGFDERFPRAYREDADLAYRIRRAGGRLVTGARHCSHPVRPEGPYVSLRSQAGNADDALLRRLYGPQWHRLLEAPAGRRHRHAGTAALAAGAVLLVAAGAKWPRCRPAAAISAAGWLAAVTEFTAARLAGAPGTARRPLPLLVTSALIPELAIWHWLVGWVRHRHARPWPGRDRGAAPAATTPLP